MFVEFIITSHGGEVMKDMKGGERLGGVVRDRLDQFRPTKDFPEALTGKMSWTGANNDRKDKSETSAVVRKY
jgi:hypothetical protein